MVYQGSHALKFVADTVGLPLDQFNFLVVQFVALISGFLFRRYMRPCPKNTLKRHLVAILWGILLGHFCFGRQMWHLFCQAFVAYLLLMFVPRKYVHLAVFFFSMAYLSGLHIYRMIYDYGNYTLDITSPFMVTTQKLTAFAFAYYDGMKKLEKLSADQKGQAINRLPHIIEFLSYIFNFQGTICGPLCLYIDYIDYITGDNLAKYKKNDKIEQPSILMVLLKKMICVIVLAILFLQVSLDYKLKDNISDEILYESSFAYRFYYLIVSTSCQRVKFYLAWVLSDAVNNASGLGFNGYDDYQNEKWDLVSNINIYNLETSTSVKSFIDNWNIQTQLWLRRMAYERLPTGKTLGVFVLSAFWHGFYPGFYFTFITFALLVYAGRGIRRNIRPYFQKSKLLINTYGVLTWFGTFLTMSFAVVPYELYDFWSSVKFYNSWYWSIHIVCIIIIFAFPCQSKKALTKAK